MSENKTPYGSEPINQMMDNSQEPAPEVVNTPAPAEDKQPEQDDKSARFEKMLQDSQSMIGKQSTEIGGLRKQIEEMMQPRGQQTPSEDEQISAITRKMDEGDMPMHEGIRQILSINSNLTASQVMNSINQQQQQEKASAIQEKFLKENPEYMQLLQSGELNKYLEADPFADNYVAFKAWQNDQKVSALQKDYDAKVQAAKEEGAKLAQGAENAGKVLGKQGNSPVSSQVNRPFKTTQEATDAMMAKLKEIRGGSV